MKVLLINTEDISGGATVACKRLLNALQKVEGLEVKLLVYQKKSDNPQITGFAQKFWAKKKVFFNFLKERLFFAVFEKNKSVRFAFSPTKAGVDISNHPLVKEADIIHLHWINFGFLSLDSLEKLFALNKPIVWTLHDMWAFTGGCHYAGNCINYQDQCGNCQPYLKKPTPHDLSFKILKRKKIIFSSNQNINFVACSRWLGKVAEESNLVHTANVSVTNIPNPIDTDVFKPFNTLESREELHLPKNKFYLLFGAMNIGDKRKGFSYLAKALHSLKEKYPELGSKIILLVFGKADEDLFEKLPFETHYLGQIKGLEKMIQAYNAADIFILPSIEDNLPNTVMESMACGKPVVAFDTGGIPEMITHLENGYLADFQSATSLSEGIAYFANLSEKEYGQACRNARLKVEANYSEELIATQYHAFYQKITS